MSAPLPGSGGWGTGAFGTSQWGSGITPGTSFVRVQAISPVANQVGVAQSQPICISISSAVSIEFASIRVAVGSTIYFFSGAAQNGATVDIVANDGNGFDIELRLPTLFPLNSRQEVTVYARNSSDEDTDFVYYFSVGVAPALVSISNPSTGILLAHFNEPMKHDSSFLSNGSWKVATITTGASDVVITKVSASSSNASTAVLHHTGGGSVYELTVLALSSHAGVPLEASNSSALFEIIYGEEDAPTIKLFDTMFGPVGISQRSIRRRTMDDHTINRSIAIGMDEQFRLRFANLDGSAGSNGRPGIRRT